MKKKSEIRNKNEELRIKDNKILIISGPTASGKTKLALKLAREFNGELISADSRQVYKGMDIVTGKDVQEKSKVKSQKSKVKWRGLPCPAKNEVCNDENIGFYEIDGVKLWGLDFVKPDQEFDVSHFIQFTNFIIDDIFKRGKLPIIVGGTGFWIKSLLNPPQTVGIPIDKKLRRDLEKLSIEQLQEKLQKLDLDKFNQMNNSDRNNPRRLIRAIEVGKKYQISNIKYQKVKEMIKYKNVLWLGLKVEDNTLAEKIAQRVKERIKNGAIEETKKLVKNNFDWNLSSMSGIGYRDLRSFIENQQNLEDTIKLWTLHEVQYAKRQMTFFRKIKGIKWYDPTEKDFFDTMKLQVQNWLEIK